VVTRVAILKKEVSKGMHQLGKNFGSHVFGEMSYLSRTLHKNYCSTTVQYLYCTVQYCTVQYWYCTVPVQYCTVQYWYSTVQYSTVQYLYCTCTS